MLVLLFYGLIKHRGDIGTYDVMLDFKEKIDQAEVVENVCDGEMGTTAKRFSSIIYLP